MTAAIPEPTTAADRRCDARALVALMYHNVVADFAAYAALSPSATSYFVTREAFAEQAAELSASGSCLSWQNVQKFYAPAGVQSVVRARGAKQAVFLTFDDGWKEAVEAGGPVLEGRRLQALVFVTTDFLGRANFLSRRDLRSLDGTVFRVGSHAKTHRMLCLLDEQEIRAELSDSKKLLEDAAGYEVDALSIPSGAVDARVRRIAGECGYRFIFDSDVRVNRRGNSPLSIGRVAVTRATDVPTFRRYVGHRIARERLRRATLEVPKRLLGLRRYEMLRRTLLGEKAGQQVTHQS